MSPPAPPHVGVLFVHGIGQQKRGETLVDFGEPLHEWISRWLTFIRRKWQAADVSKEELRAWFDRIDRGTPDLSKEQRLRRYEALRPLLDRARARPATTPRRLEDVAKSVRSEIVGAHVQLRSATLAPLPGDSPAPPQTTIDILLLMVDGSVKETQWLLAESWWAEGFQAPRFGDLAKWGLLILPWTASSHFGARIRRSLKRLHEASGYQLVVRSAATLLRVVEFFAGLMLVLSVTELVLLFLLLLSPIRISFVGRFVSAVQRRLADLIGDSYAVVVRPIQSAAIVGQVQRDLQWLSTRCDSVVMVGHSQGAAIAHLALRSAVPANLKCLLTFGSGLRKLEELRLAEASRQLAAGGLSFFGVTAVAAAAVLWPLQLGMWAIAAAALGGIALFAGMTVAVKGLGDAELSYWAGLFKQTPIDWEDYYASADPVPNGPLLDEGADTDHLLKSRQIRNLASVLADHTTYWKNLDEFVSCVAVAVGCHCPIDFTSGDMDPRNELTLKGAAVRRRWRTEWLRCARWLVGLGTMVVLVERRGDLASWGGWLRENAPAGPGLTAPDWLRDGVTGLGLEGTRGNEVLGAALLVGVALCLMAVINVCWHWWNHGDVEAFFSRRLDTEGRLNLPFFVFCTATGAVVALAVSAVVPAVWALPETDALTTVLLACLTVGLLFSGIVALIVRQLDAKARERFAAAAAQAYNAVPDTELPQ